MAHATVTTGHTHFSDAHITTSVLTRDQLADANNYSSRANTYVSVCDLPARRPSRSPQILRIYGERFNVAHVTHLSTRCDVEAGPGKDDFYLITKGNGFNCLAIHN